MVFRTTFLTLQWHTKFPLSKGVRFVPLCCDISDLFHFFPDRFFFSQFRIFSPRFRPPRKKLVENLCPFRQLMNLTLTKLLMMRTDVAGLGMLPICPVFQTFSMPQKKRNKIVQGKNMIMYKARKIASSKVHVVIDPIKEGDFLLGLAHWALDHKSLQTY